jgi:hypothetical protein
MVGLLPALLLAAARLPAQERPAPDPAVALAPVPSPSRALSPTPSLVPSVLGAITPSFSTAPRTMFRRRGPRGAMVDYARQTVWLSTNVHDVLPEQAKPFWPSPLRLSVGRRGLGAGLPAEYVVGLDLDAGRLPGTHPRWMQVKALLHTLRLPGPAIVIGPHGTRAVAMTW